MLSLIKTFLTLTFLATGLLFPMASIAASNTPIKLSVLKFGTVNWTLETIKKNGLDKKHGFDLTIQHLASTQAGKIALQANAADIIVSDWTWVARQRGLSSNYQFSPYSSAAGAIMVPESSDIRTIYDLTGKKLGIAGGALDKNWLLLRALGLENGINFDTGVDKVFGAPPLLNNLLERGELDALINFWHYSARLEAKGYRKITDTHDIISQLGTNKTIPILGYVFREQWGNDNADSLHSFFSASREAAKLLCTSEAHWNAILPLTRSTDPNTQQLLRSSYCAGRIINFTEQDKQAIADIYSILAKTGGAKLVGSVKQLNPDIFWTINRD
jgi:NitT/TauT family transport system substrate-binding protein